MPPRFGDSLAGLHIPHACDLVVASGDHPEPVRAELGRYNLFFMPEWFYERLSSLGIPNPRGPVMRRRDHPQAIGAELGGPNRNFMVEAVAAA